MMLKLKSLVALLLALVMLSACGASTEKEEDVAREEQAEMDARPDDQETEQEDETPSALNELFQQETSAEEVEEEPVDLIPEYEMTRLVYETLEASDGTMVAKNEYIAPVYQGDGAVANLLNEQFTVDADDYSLDAFQWALDEYEADVEGYTAEMIRNGAYGNNAMTVEETYRNAPYISFRMSNDWYGFGAHGGNMVNGLTMDVTTGETLALTDVLNLEPDTMGDVLFLEAYRYFSETEHHYAELMLSADYPNSLLTQCQENAVFYLGEDGVHIYFEQYTFFYAAGSAELVIPYTRTDLVKDAFAIPSDDVIDYEEAAYQAAYSQLILADIQDLQTYEQSVDLYGEPARNVALYDLTDDGVPELVYAAMVEGTYTLSVYGYDNQIGVVPYLEDYLLGVNAGAPSYTVSALSDGDLCIHTGTAYDMGGQDSYGRYTFADGTATCLLEISCTTTYDWELEQQNNIYKIGDTEVDEASFTKEWSAMESQASLLMFQLYEAALTAPEIMTATDALAYLR